MLAWISKAFAADSSKAQLVSIIISAGIAILALLLNQHFTARRSRKDILIRKIEELYQSAISYERYARALLAEIYRGRLNAAGYFELDRIALDAMNDEVERIEMLLGLYFPWVSFEKERYYAGPTLPVMEIAVKQKQISEDEALEASEQTKNNIARNAAEIKAICAGLMRKHTH